MTKVSRIKNDTKEFTYFLNNFYNILTLLDDKKQIAEFVRDLTTHTELKMLTKRVQIAKMLMEGCDYKTIKAHTKVTDPTIAKISNKLANGAKGLKFAVLRLQKIEKEIDKKRMNGTFNLKEKYPTYYLPDRIFVEIKKGIKRNKKRNSIKKYLVNS